MPSGLEILEQTIDICGGMRTTLSGADGALDGWDASLGEIAEKLRGLEVSFFFKTMPSVPASRACFREAEALKGLCDAADWAVFPDGLVALGKSADVLAEKAKMKGTTLT